MFKVVFSAKAKKQYDELNGVVRKKVNRVVDYLGINPFFGSNIKKLPPNRLYEVNDFVDFIYQREEEEAWAETEELLKNKKMMKAIKAAEKDIKSGRIFDWKSEITR